MNNPDKNSAGTAFEKSFLQVSLEKHIQTCDHYKLVPWFEKWLPDHQPILEAGCGAGRWVIWFNRRSWKAVGIDWSEKLCARARAYMPEAEFVVGDMRNMPFYSFGAIISLGAIEHAIDGPMPALKEYARILRPGGIAIIDVPFLGPIRRLRYMINKPLWFFIANNRIRSMLGKNVIAGKTLNSARAETQKGWVAHFEHNDSDWFFFEYIFSKNQMRKFLNEAGFSILEELVEFGDEGIVHNFGRVTGRYDSGLVRLNWLGRLLHRLIPRDWVGHMLCHVVQRD